MDFEQTDPVVTLDQLRGMLMELGALPLADRGQIAGLPPARADIFPTALATRIAVAEVGGFPSFRHSLFNLRYGLADKAMADARLVRIALEPH